MEDTVQSYNGPSGRDDSGKDMDSTWKYKEGTYSEGGQEVATLGGDVAKTLHQGSDDGSD